MVFLLLLAFVVMMIMAFSAIVVAGRYPRRPPWKAAIPVAPSPVPGGLDLCPGCHRILEPPGSRGSAADAGVGAPWFARLNSGVAPQRPLTPGIDGRQRRFLRVRPFARTRPRGAPR
jgi:hypothetical protein